MTLAEGSASSWLRQRRPPEAVDWEYCGDVYEEQLVDTRGAGQHYDEGVYRAGGGSAGDTSHPRVVRPIPVRLPPLYVDDLPCGGYPGPIKIPLCGQVTCRHIPCYTWHLTNPPLQLPVYRRPRVEPRQPRPHRGPRAADGGGGILKELLLDTANAQKAEAASPPISSPASPLQATVTTPGGTVTLYRWSSDSEIPETITVVSGDNGSPEQVTDAVQTPTAAVDPEPPQRRQRGRQPRPPRQRRRPLAKKNPHREDPQDPHMDSDARAALVRAIGLLRSDNKKAARQPPAPSFPFVRPSVPRHLRRVFQGVAKAFK